MRHTRESHNGEGQPLLALVGMSAVIGRDVSIVHLYEYRFFLQFREASEEGNGDRHHGLGEPSDTS